MKRRSVKLIAALLLSGIFIMSCKDSSSDPADDGSNTGGNDPGNNTTASIIDIKANGNYGFYLTSTGYVYTAYLQGTAYGSSLIQTKVAGLKNIKKIAAAPGNTNPGQYEGLALDGDGKLFTWNINFTTGKPDSAISFTQTSSFGGAVIKDISAGGDGTTVFFLALDQSGNVWSWGNNGTAMDGIYIGTYPQVISGLANITAISAGTKQGVALSTGGNVYHWGTISWQNSEVYLTPAIVSGASPASAIDAGDNYNLAKKTDGTVFAWGHLADGIVPGITSPSKISAGAELYFNPMFIKSDGTMMKTSFSMATGDPETAENVPELSTYKFSFLDLSRNAFYVTTDGKVLVQSSTGTTPYMLNNPIQ